MAAPVIHHIASCAIRRWHAVASVPAVVGACAAWVVVASMAWRVGAAVVVAAIHVAAVVATAVVAVVITIVVAVVITLIVVSDDVGTRLAPMAATPSRIATAADVSVLAAVRNLAVM